MKTVECVPNFSEGQNRSIIERIADSIRSVRGVALLDVSAGVDTNRTVYTFAGAPEDVLDAAWLAVEEGCTLIDMSAHRGHHPRLGACDVCPFVPVSEVSMDDCAALARALGERAGRELAIPVYLYGESARLPERRNLENIRAGEYEGLREKVMDPAWVPDYGPAEYSERVRKSGALVTGAREFLIAYNVNLATGDKTIAMRIAREIRERGYVGRWEAGQEERVNGLLKFCKAIGWFVEEYGQAQVSINLTNFRITNMHHAYEAVKERAARLGVSVTGSEVVGLLPKKALVESGLFYWTEYRKGANPGEKRLIQTAIQALGLNDLSPFVPEERVIEYRIEQEMG
jgi:glutamate formiminotransferase/formiminotetrahydrofolate cyclodeaminase